MEDGALILQALDDIRTAVHRMEDRQQNLQDAIGRIDRNGCARAPSHEDHEKRLRLLEEYRQKQAGGIAVLSGVVGAAASTVVSVVVQLFGGHRQ